MTQRIRRSGAFHAHQIAIARAFSLFVSNRADASRIRWAASLTVMAVWLSCALPATAQQFRIAPQFPAGSGAIAVGDFNGDGKPDVVALTEITARVLLNKGNGTFQTNLLDYPVGWGAEALVAGDFNGDGKLDLAVIAFGAAAGGLNGDPTRLSSVVSILLGNGDGSFQPHIDFPVPLTPLALAVGDFNGDGKLDLAVALVGYIPDVPPGVSILLGNGNGTFQPHQDISTGSFPNGIAVGDFNGDGKQDIVVTNSGNANTVSVLLGRGDGTFQAQTDYPAGVGPVSVSTGDFNGDQKLDLAVANNEGIAVLLGNGDGTFGPVARYQTGQGRSTGPSTAIYVGDLNSDGKADAAVVNLADNSVSVLFGNGDGTFQSSLDYGTGQAPISLAVGDFNGDGKPDLATGNAGNFGTVSMLLNNGDGTFKTSVRYATGQAPAAVILADLNGDGILDMVTANANNNTASVLLGKGDGTFLAHVDYATSAAPVSVAVGDFNRDGKLDLAVAASGSNVVSILLGKGDGTFLPHMDFTTAVTPVSATVGDFNGDGTLDLAVAASGSNVVSILLGKGDGTFGGHIDNLTAALPVSVASGDLNGDGILDLVVAAPGDPFATTSGQMSVLLGNGDGTFAPRVDYPVWRPEGVIVTDLNGDGKNDLAVANGGNTCHVLPFGEIVCRPETTLGVLLGNGDGTFQPVVKFLAGSGPSSVAVGDFNGDGKKDVVLSDALGGSSRVSMLWGNGDGTFRNHLDYDVGPGPVSVAVGDLDGDSKDDVAVALAGTPAVTSLLNTHSVLESILSVTLVSTGLYGPGSATSNPSGLTCGSADGGCTGSFPTGDTVHIVAAAPIGNGSMFTDWSGDCAGPNPCVLSSNADRAATATYADSPSFTLTIIKNGNGSGQVGVSQDLGQISCVGNTCTASYFSGTVVHVGALSDPGSMFTGWNSGGCTSAQMDCIVTMNSDLTLTATFTAEVAAGLTVNVSGSGNGTVTSNPAGINCGSSCSASFAPGTMVTLTASPAAGSTFAGWGGACSGTGACSVTMNAAESVTATFNSTTPPDFSLSPASASLTVQPGGQVTDAMTLGPKNGSFATAIELTCTVTGPAPVPTCSLNPTSVTLGANSATSTLTITVPASATLAPSVGRQLTELFYALWLPLSVLGIALVPWSKEERRRYWMPCGFFLLLVLLQAACGGGGSSNNVAKQPTNYAVTVTATSGTIQHTTSVTVTVQ